MYYNTKYYCIIIVIYKISSCQNIKDQTAKTITRLLLVMTNLHISLEAVEWRLV